ncbi:MAG: hypothetical protein PVH25_12595 [Burkholderiales bacterium]
MVVVRAMRAVIWFFVFALSVPAVADQFDDQDGRDLKADAVSRLAHSLNPAIPTAVGKVVVRQAALLQARRLLVERGQRAGLDAGWNALAPEWQQAEQALTAQASELIDGKIVVSGWFYEIMQREIAKVLNAEEADYIAMHFTTPVGKEQRILMEMRLVGEVLMANYSFTDRIDYRVPGLEDDLAQLSEAYWSLEPFRVRASMTGPESMKFAGTAAGLKYTRMLAINGINGLSAYIDSIAAQASNSVDEAEPLIDQYIALYRQRADAGQIPGESGAGQSAGQ